MNNSPETTLTPSPPSPDATARRRNPYLAFALRAGAGVAVVTVILWRVDARPVFHALASERFGWFGAAIAIYLAGQAISTWRWRLLAGLNAIDGPFHEYLAYYFVGMFTNLFVPGLIGGDAARALYLGRRHNRIGAAVASVVYDRGIGLAALFWFAAAAALTIRTIALPAALTRAVWLAGALTFAGWLAAPLIGRAATNLGGRAGRFVEPILPYLRRPLATVPAIILSLVLQASIAAAQFLIARGLGLPTPLAAFMLCVPIANVVASLPITLNGLGVREAAYLILFGYAGVARPDAIALGLLWFAATTLGGMTGVVAFITTRLPTPDDYDSTFTPFAVSAGDSTMQNRR